jgi:hypothetical protein
MRMKSRLACRLPILFLLGTVWSVPKPTVLLKLFGHVAAVLDSRIPTRIRSATRVFLGYVVSNCGI